MVAEYRWVITRDLLADLDFPEGTNMNAKGMEGPRNLDQDLKTNGANFSLWDDDRECYYIGRIYGNYDGTEPLYDFGSPNAGCVHVKINGVWV